MRVAPSSIGVLMALAMSAPVWAQSPPSDAALETSDGAAIRLAQYFGKPTVLFYEDRNSTTLNQALKDELYNWGRQLGLLQSARVIAVANLKGFDWFPARNFALAAVRDTEKKVRVPILVDWRGTLSLAPFQLPAKTSSVLVFDARGVMRYRASGSLNADERAKLLHVLGDLVGANAEALGSPTGGSR